EGAAPEPLPGPRREPVERERAAHPEAALPGPEGDPGRDHREAGREQATEEQAPDVARPFRSPIPRVALDDGGAAQRERRAGGHGHPAGSLAPVLVGPDRGGGDARAGENQAQAESPGGPGAQLLSGDGRSGAHRPSMLPQPRGSPGAVRAWPVVSRVSWAGA